MAMSLGAAVRTDLIQTRRFQDETAAEFLARGGIEWAVHYLNNLERQGHLWQAPWQHQPALFHGRRLGPGTFDLTYIDAAGALRSSLQDEESRVHLNTAPLALLAALPGLTAASAEAIVAHRQQQAWRTPEELLAHGLVTPETFYGTATHAGVSAYLTVWGSGKVNINTAPLPVLAALPGMTPAMAEALVRYRQGDDQQPGTADDRWFRTLTELRQVPEIDDAALVRVDALLTVTPTAFRVRATGRVQSAQETERVHQRLAIIDQTSRPVHVQYLQ
jgi:DNA uptake protein ComE-like DNA-binding protein